MKAQARLVKSGYMDMQAETMAGMEHAGHDHSAHAGVAAAGMGQ